jgi:hypothetical protein
MRISSDHGLTAQQRQQKKFTNMRQTAAFLGKTAAGQQNPDRQFLPSNHGNDNVTGNLCLVIRHLIPICGINALCAHLILPVNQKPSTIGIRFADQITNNRQMSPRH